MALTLSIKKAGFHIHHMDIIIPAVLVISLSGTLYGLYFISRYLGQNILKMVGFFLLILFFFEVIRVLKLKKIKVIWIVLGLLLFYSYFRSIDLTKIPLVQLSSYIWLLILSSALYKGNRARIFSVFLLFPLCFIIFSPGLSHILTFNRQFGVFYRHSLYTGTLSGLAEHYINYSMCSLMVFFIAGAHFLNSKNVLMKALFGFTSFIATVGTLTSGSRGGIVALLFGLSFFLVYSKKIILLKKSRINKYLFWLSSITVFFILWEEIIVGLFAMDINYNYGSFGARWNIMLDGMEVFLQNWFFGIGWGRFKYVVGEAAHSNWIRTAAELGIIGLVMESFVWLLFFRLALAAMRISIKLFETELTIIIIGWTSLMFSFFVWECFENIGLLGGTRLYYICYGFISACYASLKFKERAAEQINKRNT
jgi:O-antigen ligase